MVSVISVLLAAVVPAFVSAQGFDEFMRLWRPSDCFDAGREYNDGESWTVGVVRYRCIDRKRTPVECQIQGQWYQEGQGTLSRSGNYEMTCGLDSEGYMRMFISRCVYNGQRYREGETWNSERNKFWFRCEKLDELRVHIVIGGCVTDLGTRLDIGERHTVGETWYLCEKKPTDAIAFCTQGCVDNGVYYNIGQTWTRSDGMSYQCEKDNLQCRITRINGASEQTYAGGNTYTGSNTYTGGYQDRCSFSENGRIRFYIPRNSYTNTRREEFPYDDVYVICRDGDYEARVEPYTNYPDINGLTYAQPQYN